METTPATGLRHALRILRRSIDVLRSRRAAVLVLSLAALAAGGACDESAPVGPTVPLNQRFTIAPGQSAEVTGTPLRVLFLRVSADSRCPADVICIQAGDATVRVRVLDPQQAEYELHTSVPPRTVLTPSGYRVELVELQPYPFSNRPILPFDYRASLVVTR
jgi:hypothetical protein